MYVCVCVYVTVESTHPSIPISCVVLFRLFYFDCEIEWREMWKYTRCAIRRVLCSGSGAIAAHFSLSTDYFTTFPDDSNDCITHIVRKHFVKMCSVVTGVGLCHHFRYFLFVSNVDG